MKIVIGLGNPEPKYLKTLHNLGFMTADVLADRLGASFTKKPKLKSLVAETSLAGEKVLIVKPLTYMNLSGEAVVAVRNFYKVPEKDCLIIYDDLDLKIGTIRYRKNGSAGTHNGMRNIVAERGTSEYPRVRIGSEKENPFIPIIDYVLSEIPKEHEEDYKKAIKKAADCAEDFIKGLSADELMCKYNSAK